MSGDDPEVWLMNAENGQSEVFIYCDDASHNGRRKPVDTFRHDPHLGWQLVLKRTAKADTSLGGQLRASVGLPSLAASASETTLASMDRGHRQRYKLSCKEWKCKASLEVRDENLDPVLDALVVYALKQGSPDGVSEVPLRLIVARVAEQQRTKD